jgi:hypothetical protein
VTARKPPVAVPVMRIPRWRALTPDGIGHAFVGRGPATPAVCGAKNQPERYDHPRRSKCPTCVAGLEQ